MINNVQLTLVAYYAQQGLRNGRVSVCQSVRLSHSPAARRYCEFAAVRPTGRDIDRLLHGRRSAAAAPQHGTQ